jgi:hypothetical protein
MKSARRWTARVAMAAAISIGGFAFVKYARDMRVEDPAPEVKKQIESEDAKVAKSKPRKGGRDG